MRRHQLSRQRFRSTSSVERTGAGLAELKSVKQPRQALYDGMGAPDPIDRRDAPNRLGMCVQVPSAKWTDLLHLSPSTVDFRLLQS